MEFNINKNNPLGVFCLSVLKYIVFKKGEFNCEEDYEDFWKQYNGPRPTEKQKNDLLKCFQEFNKEQKDDFLKYLKELQSKNRAVSQNEEQSFAG